MQESVDDRKFWNIMKGIGIICVVVGHSGSWLTPYVYMFHMVLFVFISGYLFNERYVGDFKSFLKKRGKSLYWPTVKYRIAYALLHNVFILLYIYSPVNGIFSYSFRETCVAILKSFTLLSNLPIAGALWFVPFLLISLIFFCLVRKFAICLNPDKIEFITSVLLIGVFVLAWLLYCKGITYSWGLSSFFVQPVLYGGFLIKKKNVHVKCNLILFIISIVILFEAYQISGRFVDLASSTIVNPFFFIFVSTVGIYVSWYLSHLIMNNDYLASAVAFVGTIFIAYNGVAFFSFQRSFVYICLDS